MGEIWNIIDNSEYLYDEDKLKKLTWTTETDDSNTMWF